MATSSNTDLTHQALAAELLTLADLAGIQGPNNSIKAILDLAMIDTPPKKIHQLLRDILASKNRSKRVSSKHSSRKVNASSDPVQENSTP